MFIIITNNFLDPSSIKSIGPSAFCECKSLTEMEIPSSIITITECSLKKCSSLKSVAIPSLVTSIEKKAF